MDSSILPTGLFRELARPLAMPERPHQAVSTGTTPIDGISPVHLEPQRRSIAPFAMARRYRPTERRLRKLTERLLKLQRRLRLLDQAAETLDQQHEHLEVETQALLSGPGEGMAS